MSKKNRLFMVLALTLAVTGFIATDQPASYSAAAADGPRFTAGGKLMLPTGYRKWTFIGAPLTPNGLNGGKAGFPEYHNV